MRIAVLSPYGVADGIAIYCEALFSEIGKSHDVTFLCSRDFAYMSPSSRFKYLPCWDRGGNSVSDILEAVGEVAPDILHLQLHESYLQLEATTQLLETLAKGKCRVFVTAHSTKALGYDLAQIVTALNKAEVVYSTSEADTKYLIRNGVKAKQVNMPYWDYKLLDKETSKKSIGLAEYYPIVATHGLVNRNKGLIETAKSIALIKRAYPNVLWLALNTVNPGQQVSKDTAAELEKLIAELDIKENVLWHKDFIANNQVVVQLLSLADIGVLAYSDAGESASGAVRKFVPAYLPSVVTDIPQLREVASVFRKLTSANALAIADAVIKLLEDKAAQETQLEAMANILKENSWEKSASEQLADYQQSLIQMH